MWYFKATYFNYVTMDTKERRITIDVSPFREHEAYMRAMSEALDICGNTETLESVEFIAN